MAVLREGTDIVVERVEIPTRHGFVGADMSWSFTHLDLGGTFC